MWCPSSQGKIEPWKLFYSSVSGAWAVPVLPIPTFWVCLASSGTSTGAASGVSCWGLALSCRRSQLSPMSAEPDLWRAPTSTASGTCWGNFSTFIKKGELFFFFSLMNKAAYYTGKGGRVMERAGGACGTAFRGHRSHLSEMSKPQNDSSVLFFQTQSFSALLAAEMKPGCS